MSEVNGGRVAPLTARNLAKTFVGGDGRELTILQGVDFELEAGGAVAITGVSGAGKSTLLHLLGALDRPTGGEVFLGGRSVAGLDDVELAGVRNRDIGFVFQFHHLLREFTALENVMMPALIGGATMRVASDRARALLTDVGLAERASHKPRQLSGGEQQRVAVARALVNDPVVLLADEPSGNLDSETSSQLHDLLFDLRERRALSLVVVTHNPDLAGRADRVLVLSAGGLHPTTAV
ncbi:MAG: ABC transporter ATP-binding protein [Gemmatimonadetes bacterium]|nr:ABC transporter ATP-binding protein [Gemmatimonadota bacterium]MDA1104346.1 ABC transporter ATP-binding protein [Gemmatimonadota bacterium]